jgi:hypothetical protein
METDKISEMLYFDTEVKRLVVREYFIITHLTEKCFEIDSVGPC